MRSTRFSAAIALALGSMLLYTTASAATWTESGDADNLPGTAQSTIGTGPLTTITGTLPFDPDIDMFQIQITDKNAFTAAITPLAMFADPDIWLFDSSGVGIAANNIVAGGQCSITGTLVPANGVYYLAISSDGALAQSSGGNIWNSGWFVGGQRAPDGPGAAQAITNWGGTPVASITSYTIQLSGADFAAVPEPGSVALAAAGASAAILRRRRQAR